MGTWNGVWAVRVEPKGLSRTEERVGLIGRGRLEAFTSGQGVEGHRPRLGRVFGRRRVCSRKG